MPAFFSDSQAKSAIFLSGTKIQMSRHTMDSNKLKRILAVLGFSLTISSCGSVDTDAKIVISTGDDIIPLNSLQYQLPMVVQAADSLGSPQANITITLSVITTGYGKGFYTYQDTSVPADGTPDLWVVTTTASCASEDANNNAVLEAGEDINSNTLLEPDTPTITSHPTEIPTILGGTSTLITDSNGFGYFSLTYPKSEAGWVTVQVTATAEDGLSENIGLKSFTLFVLQADLEQEDDAPAFVRSPYGIANDCSDPS